jgi:predicted GNAT family N-acyltransferase
MTYRVVTDLDSKSTEQLQKLFECTWWTKARSALSLQKMLQGSVSVGVHDFEGNLVGFARAITDGVFKAIIADVIVTPDHRGKGIVKMLMDALLTHKALSGIEDFELYCQPDLRELYRKWGFQESPNGVIFMSAKRAL